MSVQDMHERLKKANERRNCGADEEITRLRAANAELVEALKKIARGVDCPEGIIDRPDFYASQDYFEHIANEALSRAEQAKPEPETCVWNKGRYGGWITGCGFFTCTKYENCFNCGKRVEVKK